MMRCLVFLLMLSSIAARADVVHLKRGGTIEGIVTDGGDVYNIEMQYGSMQIGKELVASVEVQQTPLTEYKSREAALPQDDADAWYQLGQWAQSQSLESLAQKDYRRAIDLNPDQAGARAALGYERVDGAWRTHDEVMAAKGYVQVGGAWVTPLQAEAMREQEQARQAEAQERWAQMQAQQAQAGAEAEAADQERQRHLREEAISQYEDQGLSEGSYLIGWGSAFASSGGAAPFNFRTFYSGRGLPGYHPGTLPYPKRYIGVGPGTIPQSSDGMLTWDGLPVTQPPAAAPPAAPPPPPKTPPSPKTPPPKSQPPAKNPPPAQGGKDKTK